MDKIRKISWAEFIDCFIVKSMFVENKRKVESSQYFTSVAL